MKTLKRVTVDKGVFTCDEAITWLTMLSKIGNVPVFHVFHVFQYFVPLSLAKDFEWVSFRIQHILV